MRIRHFGYLSNRTRRRKLAVIHQALQQPIETESETVRKSVSPSTWPCARCDGGMVRKVRQIPRFRAVGTLTA
jgi:hypothetical protein